MAASVREINESPLAQGADEKIPYVLETNVADWNLIRPVSASVTVKWNSTDATSTNSSGSVTISGTTITTPLIKSLTAGKRYRMEIKWANSTGATAEAYAWIDAEE